MYVLGGDADNGKTIQVSGQQIYGKSLYLPLNYWYCKPKTALKIVFRLSGLRIWTCHCCGTGSIPGPGNFHATGVAKKRKKKKSCLTSYSFFTRKKKKKKKKRCQTPPALNSGLKIISNKLYFFFLISKKTHVFVENLKRYKKKNIPKRKGKSLITVSFLYTYVCICMSVNMHVNIPTL